MGLGFRVLGLGFRVQGLGFRLLGFGVVCLLACFNSAGNPIKPLSGLARAWQGPDFEPRMGLGFRVQGLGFRVQGFGFRVQGSGCRDLLKGALLVCLPLGTD